MGKITDLIENKIKDVWERMSPDEQATNSTKLDANYLRRPNSGLGKGALAMSPSMQQELQSKPGQFVYQSDIVRKKAYFYQIPLHREIVYSTNAIMSATIKKIVNEVCSVEPQFVYPDQEEEDQPKLHKKSQKVWNDMQGTAVLRKALEKSIKHGIIVYEDLDVKEDWYTNSPFFVRSWDEIHTVKEYQKGFPIRFQISPSNTNLADYEIDIRKKHGANKPTNAGKDGKNLVSSGLFFDPDNTDDHDGRPWFLGSWNLLIDYEITKEARNSYNQRIGNGFMVVGIPHTQYNKVKDDVKANIKNIRNEEGLVIPVDADNPIQIEFAGSSVRVDFNADLNDIRRDIIADIGFPERWLFGDPEGAMESSGKDRLQKIDQVKNIFSKWKRFMKLFLKYHGAITDLKDIDVKAPYELQLTEQEKTEVDNLKAQTVGLVAPYLSLDEIRERLGEDPIKEEKLFNPMGQMDDPNNPKDGDGDGKLNEAKTGPNEPQKKTDGKDFHKDTKSLKIKFLRELENAREEWRSAFEKGDETKMKRAMKLIKELEDYITKTDAEEEKTDAEETPPYLLFDSIIEQTPYSDLKAMWGVSRDTIAKIKRNMRERKQIHSKTDSITLDSVEIAPNIWQSSGLIIPAQTKYYEQYKANFIRSPKQLVEAFNRHKEDVLPIGTYRSGGHDDGTEISEQAQIGEFRLDKVDEHGIYGTTVYDLSKVDEILGPDNWFRQRLQNKEKITTSIALNSTDIPLDNKTSYEMNHIIKSLIATPTPRNETAGVD